MRSACGMCARELFHLGGEGFLKKESIPSKLSPSGSGLPDQAWTCPGLTNLNAIVSSTQPALSDFIFLISSY